MIDFSTTVLEAMQDRFDLRPQNASAKNGAVSVKLHQIREALEANLSSRLKAFDEAQQRAAVSNDAGRPKPLGPDMVNVPSMTPAYEMDSTKLGALHAELAPILSETITFRVPSFSEQDLSWITSETDVGRALARYTQPT
jgi:hypothetical protein